MSVLVCAEQSLGEKLPRGRETRAVRAPPTEV